MITQEQIDRINEFARRVKAGETLTPEETAQRDILRRLYLDSVKANLTAQLDGIRIAGPDRAKQKFPRKST